MPDYTVTVASTLPTGQGYVEISTDPLQPPVQLTPGQSVILDTEAFSQIDPALFSNNTLSYTVVTDGSGQVTTQGAAVTLTSSQLGAPTGTEATDMGAVFTAYNKLQTDVAALNTALSGTGKALA
jgi:hypothetical protein